MSNEYYERAGRLVNENAWDKMWGRDKDQLAQKAHESIVEFVMALAPNADPSVVEAKIENFIAELISGFNTGD